MGCGHSHGTNHSENEMEQDMPGESGMDGSTECELDMAEGHRKHEKH